MLASEWGTKSISDKHSNESWNWLVNNSIPGALSLVLETAFDTFFADKTDRLQVPEDISNPDYT